MEPEVPRAKGVLEHVVLDNLLAAQWFDARAWAVYVSVAPLVLIAVLSVVGIRLFAVAAQRVRNPP